MIWPRLSRPTTDSFPPKCASAGIAPASGEPIATFQSRTAPPSVAVTRNSPFGVKSTWVTASSAATRSCSSWLPVSASQMRAVPSSPPVAIFEPSGPTATSRTGS